MEFIHTKYLREGLSDLERRGGKFQKAAQDVYAVLGRINQKYAQPLSGLKVTNNGESRIKHCVKYALAGACRLVTVQDSGYCILLFVGTHEQTDKWLENHKGKKFGVEAGKLVDLSKVSEIESVEESSSIPQRVLSPQKLLDRLETELVDPLLEQLPWKVAMAISELTGISTDDEIQNALIQIVDGELQGLMFDILFALAQNNVESARRVIAHHRGELDEIGDVDAIQESIDLQKVPTDSPEWVQLYEHFVKTAAYKDWMLFLHPDQKGVVERDFNGPAKLLGVSGSGKTCVLVKRALRLARKYPEQKVLILTLNRPLAKLISELVASSGASDDETNITVLPFFELCQQLIYEFEPGSEKYYSDVTWKSEEHIDAIWREFYRCDLNNNDAEIMHPVHDSLISQGVNAETYLREEFDWIRSAIAHSDRESYLEIDRRGRSFPLQRSQRKILLEGLEAWERKMREVGVIDGLGLVAALQPYLNRIKPKYRCILLDESQDFGTSELDIVRRLVSEGENDLFICGDAAQQVSIKYQKLGEANISVPGARSVSIRKNYRNSKEILKASYEVLTRHINEFHLDSEEFEVLDPEFADFTSSAPLLLESETLEKEIAYALEFVKEELRDNPSWKGCIALAGFSLYEVQVFGRRNSIAVLDGTNSIDSDSLFLSDLAQTKGFEFDVMVVVNVSEGVLPNPQVPEMEQARDLAQLYVAMTRAKTQLVLSYHHQESPLLKGLDDVFLRAQWSEYISGEPVALGIPPSLDDLNDDTAIPANIAELDGAQFLYTDHAIGLPTHLIEALRSKVGRSDPRSGKLTLGVDMGYVHQATLDTPKARVKFGAESSKALQELGLRLQLARLHRDRLESAIDVAQ